jgi:Ca2+-dependent lipid-binding protein
VIGQFSVDIKTLPVNQDAKTWYQFLLPKVSEENARSSSPSREDSEISQVTSQKEISQAIPTKESSQVSLPKPEISQTPLSSATSSSTSSKKEDEISEKSKISGELHLTYFYVPPDLSTSEEGSIKIQVLEARNLAPTNAQGTSNPYVVLKYGKKEKKTQIKGNTLNPQWNEDFEFSVKQNTKAGDIQVRIHLQKSYCGSLSYGISIHKLCQIFKDLFCWTSLRLRPISWWMNGILSKIKRQFNRKSTRIDSREN